MSALWVRMKSNRFDPASDKRAHRIGVGINQAFRRFIKSRSLSVVAALVVATAICFFAPTKWKQRLWPGWVCVVPIGALAVLAYYLTPYFTR